MLSTRGTADSMRYEMGPVMGSANGGPDSAGWVAELGHLPVERTSSKLALPRTAYRRFNGGTNDYDGFRPQRRRQQQLDPDGVVHVLNSGHHRKRGPTALLTCRP